MLNIENIEYYDIQSKFLSRTSKTNPNGNTLVLFNGHVNN